MSCQAVPPKQKLAAVNNSFQPSVTRVTQQSHEQSNHPHVGVHHYNSDPATLAAKAKILLLWQQPVLAKNTSQMSHNTAQWVKQMAL